MNIAEFHSDPRRGLCSYPAWQSRLAENPFARDGLIDLTGPVIRLDNLSRDQFGQFLGKLSQVYQGTGAPLLPEAGIPAFIALSEQRLGEATFRTPRTTIKAFVGLLGRVAVRLAPGSHPRTTIKAFVGLLAVLEQNEAADWRVLLERTEVEMLIREHFVGAVWASAEPSRSLNNAYRQLVGLQLSLVTPPLQHG